MRSRPSVEVIWARRSKGWGETGSVGRLRQLNRAASPPRFSQTCLRRDFRAMGCLGQTSRGLGYGSGTRRNTGPDCRRGSWDEGHFLFISCVKRGVRRNSLAWRGEGTARQQTRDVLGLVGRSIFTSSDTRNSPGQDDVHHRKQGYSADPIIRNSQGYCNGHTQPINKRENQKKKSDQPWLTPSLFHAACTGEMGPSLFGGGGLWG